MSAFKTRRTGGGADATVTIPCLFSDAKKVHIRGLQLLTRTQLSHSASTLQDGARRGFQKGRVQPCPQQPQFIPERAFLSPPTFPSASRPALPKEPSWESGSPLPTPFLMPGPGKLQSPRLSALVFGFQRLLSHTSQKVSEMGTPKRSRAPSGSPVHSSRQRKTEERSPPGLQELTGAGGDGGAKTGQPVTGQGGADRRAQEKLPEE